MNRTGTEWCTKMVKERVKWDELNNKVTLFCTLIKRRLKMNKK